MNNIAKNIAIWIAVALILMTVFQQFGSPNKASSQVVYSQFMENVKKGQVQKVQIDGRVITGTTRDNTTFSTTTKGKKRQHETRGHNKRQQEDDKRTTRKR